MLDILVAMPFDTCSTFPEIDMRTEMVSVFVVTFCIASVFWSFVSAEEGRWYVTEIASALLADSEYWMESNTKLDEVIPGYFAVIDVRAIARIREESTLANGLSAAMAEIQSRKLKRSMIVFINVLCQRPNIGNPK